MSQRTGTPVFIAGALGLSGIFDYDEIVFSSDFINRVHVSGLAVQMYGDNGSGAWGDGI